MNSLKSVILMCFEASCVSSLERNTGKCPLLDQKGEFEALILTGAPENFAYEIIVKHSKSTEATPQSGLQTDISMTKITDLLIIYLLNIFVV